MDLVLASENRRAVEQMLRQPTLRQATAKRARVALAPADGESCSTIADTFACTGSVHCELEAPGSEERCYGIGRCAEFGQQAWHERCARGKDGALDAAAEAPLAAHAVDEPAPGRETQSLAHDGYDFGIKAWPQAVSPRAPKSEHRPWLRNEGGGDYRAIHRAVDQRRRVDWLNLGRLETRRRYFRARRDPTCATLTGDCARFHSGDDNELLANLRTRRPKRRSKHATTASGLRITTLRAVTIADRPPSAEHSALPGRWQGDMVSGAKIVPIATLVERTSRSVQLVRVAGKDTMSVISALIREVQRLPEVVMASLT